MNPSKRQLPVATVLAPGALPGAFASDSSMTPEAVRAIMGRFTEFINTASEPMAKELIAPQAIFYVPGREEPVRGPEGYLAIIQMMRGGFPDIQWALDETIVEGNRVAARFTMRGTHRGTFGGVPASGKKISVQALNIYHLSPQGQFIQEYGQPDMAGLLAQIGAIPIR
jgi:steroid delta-isomerase-like uncharacterized protein